VDHTTASNASHQLVHEPTGHEGHHVTPMRTLVVVLIALMILTGLTVGASRIDLGETINLLLALLIASVKAALVIAVFMHLLYEKPILSIILFFCLATGALFLSLTMTELANRHAIDPKRAEILAQPEMVMQAKLNDPAVKEGQQLFEQTCASCHGPMGGGLPGLGKDMTQSEFIATTPDDELLMFIKQGRTANDPDNTTGVAMPPRGGNPTLRDPELKKIIAFMRVIRPYRGEQGDRNGSH